MKFFFILLLQALVMSFWNFDSRVDQIFMPDQNSAFSLQLVKNMEQFGIHTWIIKE